MPIVIFLYDLGHAIMLDVILQNKTLSVELQRTLINAPNTMTTSIFTHFSTIVC
jgi:hypothetical protein